MILFVIFQEPLYRAIEFSNKISPIILPCITRNMLGYADDTSFIVSRGASIIECFSIIIKFELATGMTLNKHKTKLFSMGTWKGRQLWPVICKKDVCDTIKIEGIYYSNDYDRFVLIS